MRLYPGWLVVTFAFITLMLTTGATFSAYTLYILPVSEEFGLSRADTVTGIILLSFAGSAYSPVIGRLLDKYSPRFIGLLGAIMFIAGMVGLGLSRNIWLSMFLIIVPLAFATVAAGSLMCTTLVSRWFVANRGRALAITVMGMSMASILVAPLIGLLMAQAGWRLSLIITGVIVGVLILLMLPFVKDKPGQEDVEPGTQNSAKSPHAAGQAIQAKPLTSLQIITQTQFWTIALSAAISISLLKAFTVSVVPLVKDTGAGIEVASFVIFVFGLSALAGKFALAIVADKLDRISLLAIVFLAMSASSIALAFANTYSALLAVAIFIGLCSGASIPALYALFADRFGQASYASAMGNNALVSSIVSALAVRMSGESFDHTGSYDLFFYVMTGLLALSAALVFITRFLNKGLKYLRVSV